MNEPRPTSDTRKLLAWLESHPDLAARAYAVCCGNSLGGPSVTFDNHATVRSLFSGTGLSGKVIDDGVVRRIEVVHDGIKFIGREFKADIRSPESVTL